MTRRNDRWLDISIGAAAVVAVALAGYLAYAYYSNTLVQSVSSPAGRAVENLRKTVQSSPGSVTARVRLAEALAYAGDASEAVDQYNAALKIRKDHIPALSGLASMAMQGKEYATAATYWQRIIALLENAQGERSPDLEAAYYGLGVTYLEMKRYEDAVGNLKQAARLKASASDTHYMLSVAYRGLGYPDKQREELAITLTFDPNNAQANYDFGVLSLKEGDVGSAAEAFRVAADHAPSGIDLPKKELAAIAAKGSAASRVSEARALELTDPKAAAVQARIAVALDPANLEALRVLARLWETLGDKERALAVYGKLLDRAPGDAAAAQAIKRLNPDGD